MRRRQRRGHGGACRGRGLGDLAAGRPRGRREWAWSPARRRRRCRRRAADRRARDAPPAAAHALDASGAVRPRCAALPGRGVRRRRRRAGTTRSTRWRRRAARARRRRLAGLRALITVRLPATATASAGLLALPARTALRGVVRCVCWDQRSHGRSGRGVEQVEEGDAGLHRPARRRPGGGRRRGRARRARSRPRRPLHGRHDRDGAGRPAARPDP